MKKLFDTPGTLLTEAGERDWLEKRRQEKFTPEETEQFWADPKLAEAREKLLMLRARREGAPIPPVPPAAPAPIEHLSEDEVLAKLIALLNESPPDQWLEKLNALAHRLQRQKPFFLTKFDHFHKWESLLSSPVSLFHLPSHALHSHDEYVCKLMDKLLGGKSSVNSNSPQDVKKGEHSAPKKALH